MTQSQQLITEKYSDIDIARHIQYYNDMKLTISKDLNPLFNKLGLRKTVADKKFKVILTKGIIDGHFSYGDGIDLLNMLLDDNFLLPGDMFDCQANGYFSSDWKNILNIDLLNNKTFQSIKYDILNHNGKGVGKGEYFLLLFVKGYKIKTGNSDGTINGLFIQVKDALGGSMKPCLDSSRRVIDNLNQTYFNESVPFTNDWYNNISTISNLKNTLIDYFSKLHESWDVSNDISTMVDELISTNGDFEKMKTIYGIKVGQKYKEVDKFDCLTLISSEKIVIIKDFNKVPLNEVAFVPVMKRGGDTQALADGYVNIKLK